MTEITNTKISRRQFMGTAAAGAAVLGAVAGATTLLPHAAANPLSAGATMPDGSGEPKAVSAVPKSAQALGASASVSSLGITSGWDYIADVVVLGTGLAGLSAAITATSAGANVLVLEKMSQQYEGGNSKVSGNLFWAPANVTQGATYIKALEPGQYTDDTIVNALSAGLQQNLSVIKQMGGSIAPSGLDSPEFTTLPGGSTVTMYGMNVNGTGAIGGGRLYKLYRDAVTALKINIMYSTPATGLIQDPDTNEILGVIAEGSSGTMNIQAKKGVVLACGGFEFNFPMQAQYQFGYPIYGYGTPGNTGDGILMAQKAGADLWHMNQPSGGSPGSLIVAGDYPYPISSLFGGIGSNYIWVGKDGNRYVNESQGFALHGWGVKEYTMQFSGQNAAFMRVPTWVIFDDKARAAGPFVGPIQMGWFNWFSNYTWSTDYSVEIAKGWITKAGSIADLAASITSDPDNLSPMGHPFMTASALQAAVTRFNGFATAGTDADFGRPAATMAPLTTGPFYAAKTWPSMVNTNGGPRRNVNCQVVDPSSKPIPRLFSAGECGSFWGWMYNGGGNIGECMWTGRVAGANAAAETPWA